MNYFNTISKQPSAWKDNYVFAVKLVEEFRPSVIVDLGVDYGFSTFSFANPNIGEVYGIDHFKGDENSGYKDTFCIVLQTYKELREKFGINNITFITGDFSEVCKKWDKHIDILHIDGLHTMEAITDDFNNWSKFTDDKSIILFHDILAYRDTIGEFFDNLAGFKTKIYEGAGLGVLTKDSKVFERINKLLGNIR